jgi:hypothetical protein
MGEEGRGVKEFQVGRFPEAGFVAEFCGGAGFTWQERIFGMNERAC